MFHDIPIPIYIATAGKIDHESCQIRENVCDRVENSISDLD
jgi:hypothetical protein